MDFLYKNFKKELDKFNEGIEIELATQNIKNKNEYKKKMMALFFLEKLKENQKNDSNIKYTEMTFCRTPIKRGIYYTIQNNEILQDIVKDFYTDKNKTIKFLDHFNTIYSFVSEKNNINTKNNDSFIEEINTYLLNYDTKLNDEKIINLHNPLNKENLNNSEELDITGLSQLELTQLLSELGKLYKDLDNNESIGRENITLQEIPQMLNVHLNDKEIIKKYNIDIKNGKIDQDELYAKLPDNHILKKYYKTLKDVYDKVDHYNSLDINLALVNNEIKNINNQEQDFEPIFNEDNNKKIYCYIYQYNGKQEIFPGTKAEIEKFVNNNEKLKINKDFSENIIQEINMPYDDNKERIINTNDIFNTNGIIIPLFPKITLNPKPKNIDSLSTFYRKIVGYQSDVLLNMEQRSFMKYISKDSLNSLNKYKEDLNLAIKGLKRVKNENNDYEITKRENLYLKNYLDDYKINLEIDNNDPNKLSNYKFKNKKEDFSEINQPILEKELTFKTYFDNLKNNSNMNKDIELLEQTEDAIFNWNNEIKKEIQNEQKQDPRVNLILKNIINQLKENKTNNQEKLSDIITSQISDTDFENGYTEGNNKIDGINELLTQSTYDQNQLLDANLKFNQQLWENISPNARNMLANPITTIMFCGLNLMANEINEFKGLYFAYKELEGKKEIQEIKETQMLEKAKNSYKKQFQKIGLDPALVDHLKFGIKKDKKKGDQIIIKPTEQTEEAFKRSLDDHRPNQDISKMEYNPLKEMNIDLEKLNISKMKHYDNLLKENLKKDLKKDFNLLLKDNSNIKIDPEILDNNLNKITDIYINILKEKYNKEEITDKKDFNLTIKKAILEPENIDYNVKKLFILNQYKPEGIFYKNEQNKFKILDNYKNSKLTNEEKIELLLDTNINDPILKTKLKNVRYRGLAVQEEYKKILTPEEFNHIKAHFNYVGIDKINLITHKRYLNKQITSANILNNNLKATLQNKLTINDFIQRLLKDESQKHLLKSLLANTSNNNILLKLNNKEKLSKEDGLFIFNLILGNKLKSNNIKKTISIKNDDDLKNNSIFPKKNKDKLILIIDEYINKNNDILNKPEYKDFSDSRTIEELSKIYEAYSEVNLDKILPTINDYLKQKINFKDKTISIKNVINDTINTIKNYHNSLKDNIANTYEILPKEETTIKEDNQKEETTIKEDNQKENTTIKEDNPKEKTTIKEDDSKEIMGIEEDYPNEIMGIEENYDPSLFFDNQEEYNPNIFKDDIVDKEDPVILKSTKKKVDKKKIDKKKKIDDVELN